MIEADVRYPTDIGLAADAHQALCRRAAAANGAAGPHARAWCATRSGRARRQRKLNRTLAARRTGQGKLTALRLTGEAGALVERLVARGAPAGRASARLCPCRGARAQAGGRAALGGAGRRAPARLPPDPSAAGGREDHRPAGLDGRPRRPADPQGQAAARRPSSATSLQLAELAREHAPRRPRADPARRQPDRLAERARPAARDRRRAGPPEPAPARASRSTAASSDRRRRATCPTPSGVHRRARVCWIAPRRSPAGAASASGSRDASATSSAATACADHGSKATTAPAPAPPGPSSP